MNKKIFIGMLGLLFVLVGTPLFAERVVTSREMERLVNTAVADSDRAYGLAMRNYKANEREIEILLSKIENTLIAIENLQNKGESLVPNQEKKIQAVMANSVSILRMKEKADR
jgi:hypothetical protein